MVVHVIVNDYRIMLCSDNCLAGIRTFTLSVDSSRGVRFALEGQVKDSISLANPADPQTSTLLAYRPQYGDLHGSDLGALFCQNPGSVSMHAKHHQL